ncbi:hypothetical protein TrLO_g14525 [Triparma laevis f. longispina]|uniref:CH-like domain-containing protein n=1 Tax=Triparma laevis f. longispina TaxID=1714387 RepID=A0A9W7AMD0_9STRA|nr:hypothetical protein TrLO_g14525 [Triparma laevis f. longispina]
MSSYVSDWLNHELVLSTKITVPSKQFANGYLFGEVLVALNWLTPSKFSDMRNSSTSLARLENFMIVEQALRSNGVQFDRKVSIPLIVTEARGAAADLLLKIKNMKASQDNPPPKPPPPSTTSVRPKEFKRGPMTDWGTDDFFLRTMEDVGTHNFNKLDETIHLRKFHDTQRSIEREQTSNEEGEVTQGKERVKMRITEQLQMARDRAAFMNKMIEEGKQSWQVNEDKRIEFERQRLRFEIATVATRDAKRENDRLKHTHDQKTNISGFERNMKRLGVGNDDTDDGEYRPSNESGLNYLQRLEDTISEAKLKPEANFEAMENLKRTEKVNRRARKERETRRRKMFVDQKNASADLEKKEAYGAMMEGLASTSIKMRNDAMAKWEVKKQKEIEAEERDNRTLLQYTTRIETAEIALRTFFDEAAEKSLTEEALVAKTLRLEEINEIKAESKAKKRVTATNVSEAAVDKLLDLVEIMCVERVAAGGPVPPQVLRDLKKVYVSGQQFYEDPIVEEEDEWNLSEEAGGWAEGEAWINGGELWGWPELDTPDFVDNEALISYDDKDYEVGVKACLASLIRDYESIFDYVKWTKYEYASFLRRKDEGWAVAAKAHKKKIPSMPTEDNTDLEEIEDAIDLLEEDLGEVAEERADSSRDVCDGSSGRAREWMAGVVNSRVEKMKELLMLIVRDAADKVEVLKKEPSLLIELGAEDSDEGEGEEKKADGGDDEEGETPAEEKEEVEETEEEKEEKRRQEENELMGSEYEFEVGRLTEIQKRKQLKTQGLKRLAASEQVWKEAFANDAWLTEYDGAGGVLEELDRIRNHFAETDDIYSFYNAVSVGCALMQGVVRVGKRVGEFVRKVGEVEDDLCSVLNGMCVKRAKVENDAIVEFAERIGAAASSGWKDVLNFAIDLSGDARISIDATFPGVVSDGEGKELSPRFVVALAKKFKASTNGNFTVSVGSFVKIVHKVVEKEGARGGNWGWTEKARLEEALTCIERGTGRVPWRKYIHFLCCYFLPTNCPVEELVKAGGEVRMEGQAVYKREMHMGLSLHNFMQAKYWFEVGGMDAEVAALLKEAYSVAFGDDAGEFVDMTELLASWACVKEEVDEGRCKSNLGLFRAMAGFVGGAGGEQTQMLCPGKRGGGGPAIDMKGLEALIAMDYSTDVLNIAEKIFAGKEAGVKMDFSEISVKVGGWNGFVLERVMV